jgi:hypothetical protein
MKNIKEKKPEVGVTSPNPRENPLKGFQMSFAGSVTVEPLPSHNRKKYKVKERPKPKILQADEEVIQKLVQDRSKKHCIAFATNGIVIIPKTDKI